jgi:rubrerythrin
MYENTQYTYEDVIGYAVLIEQRGIKLYTDAAKGLKNEPARNILLHLAEQERQHEQYFLQLKDEVKTHDSRKVDMDDQSLGYLAALAESEIFSDDGKPYDQKFKTLQDVIEFGMQTEKDSILFYVELSRLNGKRPQEKY